MYIYPYSLEYAIKYDEREQWRESYQANCDCARAMKKLSSGSTALTG